MNRRGFLGMATMRLAAACSLPIVGRLADSSAPARLAVVNGEIGVIANEVEEAPGGWMAMGEGQVFVDQASGEIAWAGAWVDDAGEIVPFEQATRWEQVALDAAGPLTERGQRFVERIVPEFAR